MGGKLKYLLTGLFVLIAVVVIVLKYWDYITNPWTRDGQVRAQVIRIHLDKVSEDIKLRVGTTASVLVMTGTSGSKSDKPGVAAPKALQ